MTLPGSIALGLSTGTWVLLVVMGIILGLVVRARSRAGRPSKVGAAPMTDLANLSIRDARRGDMITVRAAAPDYEDLTFSVEKIHRYESGGDRWQELQGKSPHGMASLEWYDDDGLEISLVLGKETLRIDALGLNDDDLVRYDEGEAADRAVEYDGEVYRFDSSGEVGYFEDGGGSGEGYYAWEFTSKSGKKGLSIEKWEGEAFEALISASIEPSDITIYRS